MEDEVDLFDDWVLMPVDECFENGQEHDIEI